MSFILDALKKSQQARHPGPPQGPRGAVHNLSISMSSGGRWLAASVILLLGVIAAMLIFWSSTRVSAPIVTTPEVVPPLQPVADISPAVSESIATPTNTITKPLPVVKDLAEVSKIPTPVRPKKKVSVAAKPKLVVNRPAKPLSPKILPAVPIETDDTPLLQQMSSDFQSAIQPMAVTIHVYSPEETQRILFINNREYHKGDMIEGSIRVEKIVPDGVVLSYRDERFKLNRPR